MSDAALFASDNETPACPEVLAAVIAANEGGARSYGEDKETAAFQRRFSEFFEADVLALPVATGTAANALALSMIMPRFGAVLCHQAAHVQTMECSAAEFWSQGGKLLPLPGRENRVDPDAFEDFLKANPAGCVYSAHPTGISLTQGTEVGTVYSVDSIAQVSRRAHAAGMNVHMDGARLMNAVASLGCSVADLTWRAGVDILSFGATKNGGMCADAVVIFDRTLAQHEMFTRIRSGQLFSKMRFVSSQLSALVQDGVALRNARQANAMALRLATGLRELTGVSIRYPVEINMVFAELPADVASALAIAKCLPLQQEDTQGIYWRLVCGWNTTVGDVDHFLTIARSARRGRV